MWDKALMSWLLIGLVVACLLIYPRAVLARIRWPAVLLASSAFLLGMLPLLVYNIDQRGETATRNTILSVSGIPLKVDALRQTIDGSMLFGYMVGRRPTPPSRAPRTLLERFPVAVSQFFGHPRHNWMVLGWAAVLFGLAALRQTRWWRLLLFLLTAMVVAWLQMTFTKGAGGSSHHVILLWPLPAVFLGVAFTGLAELLPRRGTKLVTIAVAFLIFGNLLVTNEYLADLIANGSIGPWTDAIYPLSESLRGQTEGWIGEAGRDREEQERRKRQQQVEEEKRRREEEQRSQQQHLERMRQLRGFSAGVEEVEDVLVA